MKSSRPPLNRRRLLRLFATLPPLAAGRHLWAQAEPPPQIPSLLAGSLPKKCRQVLLVLSPARSSVPARLWMLERTAAAKNDEAAPGPSDWKPVSGPFPVVLGRNGLAWGLGDHTPAAPAGWPAKKEGDGCSPAGVFPVTFAFGSDSPGDNAWIKLPYRLTSPTLRGVDDPASRYYNQVIDETTVTPDWNSSEDMLREDGVYRWGAFIAHNPKGERARGSCIFLHLWRGPDRGTAGCTAMPEPTLRRVLGWLDPACHPCLVQTVEDPIPAPSR